ncbi:MAG: glycosyltransferase family 87 protein [Planctomycetota bacterium]
MRARWLRFITSVPALTCLQTMVWFVLLVTATQSALELDHDSGRYFDAARRCLASGDLYAATGYLYPPLLATLLAPLVSVGASVAAVCWAFIITAAAWAAVRLLAQQLVDLRWRRGAELLLTIAILKPLGSSFLNGQVNTLVLLAFVVAIRAAQSGRRGGAGFWIALAAWLKVWPSGMFVLYFLSRSWRSVGGFLVGCLLFGLLIPALVLGENLTKTYRDFAALSTVAATDYQPGVSLKPLVYRLTGANDALRPSAQRNTWLAMCAVVAVLGIALYLRAERRDDPLLAYAVAIIVMLLAAPIVRKALHVLMLVPYFWLLLQLRCASWREIVWGGALGGAAAMLFVLGLFIGGIDPPLLPLLVVLGIASVVVRLRAPQRWSATLAFAAGLPLASCAEVVGRAGDRLAQASAALAYGPLLLLVALVATLGSLDDSGADLPSAPERSIL